VKVVHKFAEEGAWRPHARTDAINRIKKTEHVPKTRREGREGRAKLHDDHLKLVTPRSRPGADIMEV